MKGFVRNQIRTKPATNRRQSKKEKEKKGNDIAIMASSVGATENLKKEWTRLSIWCQESGWSTVAFI